MLAIIPARGGSKRIPKKNIKFFLGKPMISYAIETARLSGLFDEILVTTDCPQIAKISRQHGALVPALRRADLADDHTPTVPVIRDAISTFYRHLSDSDIICCIYPCTPLLKEEWLVQAADSLKESNAINTYVMPVLEFPSAPQRALKIEKSGLLSPKYPQYELSRTQDLEELFYDAGQFYLGFKSCWMTNDNLHTMASPLIIPNGSVVDIDTPDDWTAAENKYQSTR